MRVERGGDPGPYRHYGQYKSRLREIFRYRCAYCLTPEERCGGSDSMTVDHFHPQSRYPHLRLSWINLYYACIVCNSHYKKEYPTVEEERAGFRFVDPCAEDPDEHFRLSRDPTTKRLCIVRPLTDPAKYTALKLRFNERKSLRDFWVEIEKSEREVLDNLQAVSQIRDNLNAAAAGTRPIKWQREALSQCEQLLIDMQRRLQTIRGQRPFPFEESLPNGMGNPDKPMKGSKRAPKGHSRGAYRRNPRVNRSNERDVRHARLTVT